MLLEILGFVGLITLLCICAMLSIRSKLKIFLVVGQDVFRWLSFVLVAFLVTRALRFSDALDVETARNINSIIFITAVAGISWSVWRHGKSANK